ncbi:MAG: DegT/DnrJ/EryC1/StrS family aminotransferase, partial [Rhodospirillaceae bacterium]
MSAPIFAPWPFYAEDEIAAVAAVLHSGKVNYRTGPEGKLFEAEYAAATGAKHALTVANGTAALELALEALEIGPGDEVIVPARTFIATASAVVRCGAIPVVADVDLRSQTLNENSIAAVLSEKTKAI